MHVRCSPGAGHGALLTDLREQLKAGYGGNHLAMQVEDADLVDEEVHFGGYPRCMA